MTHPTPFTSHSGQPEPTKPALTKHDYDLLKRLDYTPRFVSGDYSGLVTRGYVAEYRPEWTNTFLYSLTDDGARLKRWYWGSAE